MKNNESKFSQSLKKVGNVLTIIMPIISLAYYFWVRFRIPLIFYVSNYKEISLVGVLVLSAGYIFTIGLLIFAKSSNKFAIRKLGVVVFALTIPLCCLGNAIFLSLPTVMDKAEISNTTYYLTGEIEVFDVHTFHHLYKCDDSRFACEQTSFYEGGDASFDPLRLMIDKTTNLNEINVIWVSPDGNTFLGYTYGAQPRYYDYPAQLNDHFYYLAYYDYPNSPPTTFVLFECKLDNTSCKQLPILYTGLGRSRETIADETTGEISVFMGNEFDQKTLRYNKTLIFTWGENPRCYVPGCEILEETK